MSLATANKCPHPMADKNLHDDKTAQGKDGDTNVHRRVAANAKDFVPKPAHVSTVEEGMALNTETAREPSPSNNQIIVYSSNGPDTEHVTAGCPWHEGLNTRNRRSLLFATR